MAELKADPKDPESKNPWLLYGMNKYEYLE